MYQLKKLELVTAVGSAAHWNYSKSFYNERLTTEQRKLFHGFVFDPPELRM